MMAASTLVNGRTTAPWAVVLVMMVVACSPSVALAADGDARPPATFAPGDISIGEPIALPFAKSASPDGTAPAAAPPGAEKMSPVAGGGPGSVAGPATEAASGWLGLTVAESTVPGRWSIVDVAPGGPAAGAGIRVGDELRAINGAALRNGDEVAQALTAISAGQTVRLSVARSDRMSEVPMTASPRPTAAATREWQPSTVATGAVAPRVPDAVPLPTTSVLTEPRPTRDPPVALPAASAMPAAVPTPALAAPRPESPGSARGRTALGVRTTPIDPGIQARFRLPEATGAYVISVVGDLPASKAGIPPGSVIVKLDERPVRSPQELTQLVTSGPVDRPVAVQYVLPGGTERRADVVLQALELPLEKALTEDPGLQPGMVPTLVPGPDLLGPDARTSRRPVTRDDGEADELRREVGRLRAWLDVLERRLDRSDR